ncbi:MAG: anti-sigma factor, partial [Pseudarthrobacter sp.]|nr:anti-sigma factor [Pseudarthrobacter sp.]
MRSHNPFKGGHHRSDSHLKTCAECASAVRRERDYLERLREAAIPPASHDLTARLLDRTHMLALAPCEPAGAPPRGARALAIAAG